MKTYTEEQLNKAYKMCEGKPSINSTNIVCLGQSDGSKGVRFTLYRFVNADEMFSLNDPMKFQCVLAEDLIHAVEKARKICGDTIIELWADSNNTRVTLIMRKRQFNEQYPDVEKLLNKYLKHHYILADISYRFEKNGYLSEKQVELVNKLVKGVKKQIRKRRKEEKREKELKQFEGHHYDNGEKVEMNLVEIIKDRSWNSDFGRTYLIQWITDDNKIVQYIGGSPPYGDDGIYVGKVKATIKHVEYKGEKQTKIQRIKLI